MRPPDPRRLLLALALLAAAALLWPQAAQAQEDAPDGEAAPGGIDVVQIDGLLDPANAALLRRVIGEAERRGSTLVVVQLAGTGAVGVDVGELVDLVAEATVPIGVWVGPSGTNARGASAVLALAAPVVHVAARAGIGPAHPVRFDEPGASGPQEVAAQLRALQERHGRDPAGVEAVVAGRLSANRAEELGLVDGTAPIVGEFIVRLDGETVTTAAGDVTLDTAEVVGEGLDRRRQLNQPIRFHKLDLGQQLAHTLVTPWIAYFLFVVGFALIVFEFFTAGVGVAGFVGALSVAGATYGFSHLPVAPWAVALLLLGLVGLSIDLQAGGLGPWTYIGSAALVAGSVWLYGGSSRLDPAWWVIVLVSGGTVVFMLSGMTAMIRSRFSTPTIGREDLVGEIGTAEVAVAPEGVVRVRDALWRARTNRATPIGGGDRVRVVAVEGVLLEVEPEAGGAKDYRDRGRRR